MIYAQNKKNKKIKKKKGKGCEAGSMGVPEGKKVWQDDSKDRHCGDKAWRCTLTCIHTHTHTHTHTHIHIHTHSHPESDMIMHRHTLTQPVGD